MFLIFTSHNSRNSIKEIMGKTQSFKDEFTFEQRSNEAADMLAKYPERVPVIAVKYSRTDLPELEKKKAYTQGKYECSLGIP